MLLSSRCMNSIQALSTLSGRNCVRGVYAVTPDLADTRLLLAQTRAALAGGVRLVQYRNKTAADTLRREQADALQDLCRRHSALLIVNDDVELAHAVGAAGVHVGAGDAEVAAARQRLGAGRLIGASCYGDLRRAETATAHGADYVAFGSFFDSTIKPDAVRAPLSILQAARERTALPLVAIGGITLANVDALIAAGADAVAVISALFAAADIEAAARAFCLKFTGSTP